MTEADPLAVYIHWPYCARICPYCDFNVYKARNLKGLTTAILTDLDYWRRLSGPRLITSIHFGGGTPSLMRPQAVEEIIAHIRSNWDHASDLEVGLEANPTDCDRFASLSEAGVNRLSIGVQSFDDMALAFLGRDHDGAQAEQAVRLARSHFPVVSLDMIFGWSGQTMERLNADLDKALAQDIHHLSTYQLTIEDNTAFARASARGQDRALPADESAHMYEYLSDRLIRSGYEHYEVSNFARPGYRSRHNLAYWKGVDYIGVGPGAHGRLTTAPFRLATIAALRPEAYIARVGEAGTGMIENEELTDQDRADEYVIMGLRISDGISLSRWRELCGSALPETRISELVEGGYLSRTGDGLRATDQGRRVLNNITDALLISDAA